MGDAVTLQQPVSIPRELRTELIRKSVHLLVATVPVIVTHIGTVATLFLLAAGTLLYTWAEFMRQRGHTVPVITRITVLSSRNRDQGHFILGPVTLGLGAMMALLLYPDPGATIAVYALAFGDGVASVAGKLLGRTTLPFTGGKTLEGSLACGTVVAMAAYLVLGSWGVALAAAATAMFLEALPSRDADNLLLPAGVGLMVTLVV